MSELQKSKIQVCLKCPYIQKKSAKGLDYTFANEAELIKKLRPAMLEHGITVAPIEQNLEFHEVYKTSSGKSLNRVVIKVKYCFSHISGDFQNVVVFGEAADISDKSIPKAQTIALKYALRQFFLIETGDDPDFQSHEVRDEVSEVDNVFRKCKAAVLKAANVKMLDSYREAIKSRGFSAQQISDLEQLCSERELHLKGGAK